MLVTLWRGHVEGHARVFMNGLNNIKRNVSRETFLFYLSDNCRHLDNCRNSFIWKLFHVKLFFLFAGVNKGDCLPFGIIHDDPQRLAG
jgi:hypothetical protein